MADISSSDSVRVTGEERPHPAIRKLARALIALARLRQAEDATEADDLEDGHEVDHG